MGSAQSQDPLQSPGSSVGPAPALQDQPKAPRKLGLTRSAFSLHECSQDTRLGTHPPLCTGSPVPTGSPASAPSLQKGKIQGEKMQREEMQSTVHQILSFPGLWAQKDCAAAFGRVLLDEPPGAGAKYTLTHAHTHAQGSRKPPKHPSCFLFLFTSPTRCVPAAPCKTSSGAQHPEAAGSTGTAPGAAPRMSPALRGC